MKKSKRSAEDYRRTLGENMLSRINTAYEFAMRHGWPVAAELKRCVEAQRAELERMTTAEVMP